MFFLKRRRTMRYLQSDELQIATRFLFLSMAIVVIQQDIKHIQKGAFKIKEPYVHMLEKMISEATKERRSLRKSMEREQIRVVTLHTNDPLPSFLFLGRGKEEKRTYFNPAIRKKVEVIVQALMHRVQPPA